MNIFSYLASVSSIGNNLQAFAGLAPDFFSHRTWDVILVIALVAISFFYGVARGKHKLVSTILFTYVAYAVATAVPADTLIKYTGGITDLFLLKTAVFLGILLLLLFLFGRQKPRLFTRTTKWWQVFILSLTKTGLITHIIFSFLPPARLKLLAPFTRAIIANPDYHLWWLAGPIAILIMLRLMGMKDE